MNYKSNYHDSFALIIGINEYQLVSPLEIACADAASIHDILAASFGFPKSNISLLLDGKATRKAIMEKFLSYEKLDSDDRLLVFFAGHGTTVSGPRGNIGYLVPVDGSPEDKSSLIRWDDLTRNADIIPAKHILFIMDACYSGLAIQRTTNAGEQRFVTDMMQRSSRQVLTAGKADEVVADGGGPTGNNSIFTGHLIEGMRGGASSDSGVITASALMSYTYRKVSTDSRSNQTPHFGHIDGDGDFILKTPDNAVLKPNPHADYLVKTVADRPEPPAFFEPTLPNLGFAEKRGYSDPDSPTFGRNEWTKKLGYSYWLNGEIKSEAPFGWLSLLIEPVSNEPIKLDVAALAQSLRNFSNKSTEPFQQFQFPSRSMTTARSLILFDPDRDNNESSEEHWNRFMRIEQNGAIEFCELSNIACKVSLTQDDKVGFPVFWYVQAIGTIWSFMYAAKRLLDNAGYTAGVRYVVNFIGTANSFLGDFAVAPGAGQKRWQDIFERSLFGSVNFSKLKCHDPNLQFEFKLVIGSLGEREAFAIVRECAERLGLAYNHQSAPRCFNFGTDEFPWKQFLNHQR